MSTTVVNPSIWMPAYNESPWNAVFFVTFIIVSIFYLHSLVLSVVFQVFIQSATEVHRRSVSDKENSLKLAFLALAWTRQNPKKNEFASVNNATVDANLIKEMLQLMRPHYNQQKLNVLLEIIVPSRFERGSKIYSPEDIKLFEIRENDNKHNVNFDQFRTSINQALSSSIRATRTHSTLGLGVEVFSVLVSILNFVYVMAFASRVHPDLGHEIHKREFIIGCGITIATLFEASLRYKVWQYSNRINPITRLNTILDGMGCLGGVVSFVGTSFDLIAEQYLIRSSYSFTSSQRP